MSFFKPMSFFRPMLFSTLKNYSKDQFIKDIVSGIIVAIIALPLSIALALASGVGPEQGLYTAIIAGFLISFFGGSAVQIAGPTAAFATIVAGIVAKSGFSGMVTATIIAGIILCLMGIFRLGSLITFIPYTISTGFTAGIAVTILIGQIKDFAGLTYPAGTVTIETREKVTAIIQNIHTINPSALLVGIICLTVLIVWPKISSKIPGSIVAVVIGILMVKILKLPVNTIGDLYTISNKLPTPDLPEFSIDLFIQMFPDGVTIAILAAIESLLSCVVADGMINSKHRPNTELMAQGIGNIGSVLFGGIPATGAIARTAANIKSGGRTPVAGMVHSVALVLILVLLMPYAAWIPMPTIAAILFMVAYNMCQWRPFVSVCKSAPKSDIFVLILTFILTIVFDLVVAIEFGMICACMLFMKRMSDDTEVQGWKYYDEEEILKNNDLFFVPKHVRVYEVSGPLFFGAAEVLTHIKFKDFTKCLILRMRSVPDIDITAMNALNNLYESCQKNNIRLILSHVNEKPMKVMTKAGLVEKIGNENFRPNIEDALRYAASFSEVEN